MEFFEKANFIRLRSHLKKYLFAENDEESVRQSRKWSSRRAIWTVESVHGKPNVVALKSCYGKYLTAPNNNNDPQHHEQQCLPSSPSFHHLLLSKSFGAAAGKKKKKVLQTSPTTYYGLSSPSLEWEPIRHGFQVKLRTCNSSEEDENKFLCANGGAIATAGATATPWKNTISTTHGSPNKIKWLLWEVEVVDISEVLWFFADLLSPVSSYYPSDDDESPVDSPRSAPSSVPSWTRVPSWNRMPSVRSWEIGSASQKGMELFHQAKTVRLRSHHDKYLLADDDGESVNQDRHGSSKRARWNVEFVDGIGSNTVIRLKSCYGKYLTATDKDYLLGVTGKKVLQTMPRRLDSSIEWEPIRDGHLVKLKTRYGNYLRANGGLPPWRNSITHDVPHRTHTQEWILWGVDILAVQDQPTPPPPVSSEPTSPRLSKLESNDSFVCSPPKADGRLIYFYVANDHGDVEDEDSTDGPSFIFKGNGVDELKQKLEEETGLEDIYVCTRSPLNGNLYPLRLHLPPNNTTMHVIVVKSSSRAARNFVRPGSM